MKTNELRIGNIVLINGLRTEVSLLVLKHLIEENIQFTVEGLKISEKMLFSLGFVPCSFIDNRYDYGDQFHIIPHNEKLIFRGLGMSIVEVKTVHHLQNLIFSLTGQELNTSGLL